MFRFLAIALVFLGIAGPNGYAEDLSGEVTVIESKDGSSITIEQAQVRVIAGQSFIGGKVLSTDVNPGTAKVCMEIGVVVL